MFMATNNPRSTFFHVYTDYCLPQSVVATFRFFHSVSDDSVQPFPRTVLMSSGKNSQSPSLSRYLRDRLRRYVPSFARITHFPLACNNEMLFATPPPRLFSRLDLPPHLFIEHGDSGGELLDVARIPAPIVQKVIFLHLDGC